MLTIGSILILYILVENQGHHTGSSEMQDPKGMVGNVTINKKILTSWEMYPLNLDNITGWERPRTHSTSKAGEAFTPTFYSGFIYPTPDGIPKDTFMRFRSWHKVQMSFVCILTNLTEKCYVLGWIDTAQTRCMRLLHIHSLRNLAVFKQFKGASGKAAIRSAKAVTELSLKVSSIARQKLLFS